MWPGTTVILWIWEDQDEPLADWDLPTFNPTQRKGGAAVGLPPPYCCTPPSTSQAYQERKRLVKYN